MTIEEILEKIKNIILKHEGTCVEDYHRILSSYSNKVMSKGVDIYGMFFPDKEYSKYFTYKGRITKNEEKKDFCYYFDQNGKLLLTERCPGGVLLAVIIFYYYDDLTEIVWYNPKEKRIKRVGWLDYENGMLTRFLDEGKIDNGNLFMEYDFNTGTEYIDKKSYLNYSLGSSKNNELIVTSKMLKK